MVRALRPLTKVRIQDEAVGAVCYCSRPSHDPFVMQSLFLMHTTCACSFNIKLRIFPSHCCRVQSSTTCGSGPPCRRWDNNYISWRANSSSLLHST